MQASIARMSYYSTLILPGSSTPHAVRHSTTSCWPALCGRAFGPQDQPPVGSPKSNSSRTALINQTLAKRYFGNANPLGRHFHFGDQLEPNYEIIGVVKDVKYRSLRDPAQRPILHI